MKRTFCDRCEAPCVNTTVTVTVVTIHHTKNCEYVGTDEHKPVEICLNCADELKQSFPQIFILAPRDEMMMERPVEPPFPGDSPVRDRVYVNDRVEERR